MTLAVSLGYTRLLLWKMLGALTEMKLRSSYFVRSITIEFGVESLTSYLLDT
jgi:hypothetical protein